MTAIAGSGAGAKDDANPLTRANCTMRSRAKRLAVRTPLPSIRSSIVGPCLDRVRTAHRHVVECLHDLVGPMPRESFHRLARDLRTAASRVVPRMQASEIIDLNQGFRARVLYSDW
jgi:hypothetical protein